MEYYENVYKRRLNRFGIDYQTRTQKQREYEFERYLNKSVYRLDFEYEGEFHPATLERYKQNETKTQGYFLTRVNLNIPNGTILMLPDKDMQLTPWMIFWLENIKASGYNRYVVLKMTHEVTWKDRDGNEQRAWAYFYGQEDNMLKDELKSRSRMDAVYNENLKSSFFITPANPNIRKDDYIELSTSVLTEAFVVTGYDLHSNEGVEFVTVDPQYLRDHSEVPEQQEGEEPEQYQWFGWGGKN